jgi:hypothetical protein
MLQRIRDLLKKVPFTPFVVHTNGGRDYRVETAKHAQVSPTGSQVNIWFDHEGGVTLSDVHINAVEIDEAPLS